jgi:hypothetical protein
MGLARLKTVACRRHHLTMHKPIDCLFTQYQYKQKTIRPLPITACNPVLYIILSGHNSQYKLSSAGVISHTSK